jgi:uncharacterized membrane protein YgdD (TMEM256/DUF423 family)
VTGVSFGVLGALSGLIALLAGAFGTHALRGRLDPGMLQVFETAARYQMFHALALVAVWLAEGRARRGPLIVAGALFASGTLLFSGSLYVLSVTGVRAWGAVTPFGGLCLIAGWASLAIAITNRRSHRTGLV